MAQKVIKFYATWCGPCKIYGKAFDKVKNEYAENDEFEFIEVDIDKDTEGLANQYKVDSVPTTVRVKENGTTLDRVGRLSVSDLKAFLIE